MSCLRNHLRLVTAEHAGLLLDTVLESAARIDSRDSAIAIEAGLKQAEVTGDEPAHAGTDRECDMDAALAALRKRRETDERR